jgi:hypothetical protein
VYFTLVHSTPSISLLSPFTSHSPFSTAFNTRPHILYLHRCCALWYHWCSIIPFSFPSFPVFHRVVLLLQTCSTYEFVYDNGYFCEGLRNLDLTHSLYRFGLPVYNSCFSFSFWVDRSLRRSRFLAFCFEGKEINRSEEWWVEWELGSLAWVSSVIQAW